MPKHNFIDLSGQQFGRLKVVERATNAKDDKSRWHCLCSCGTATVVSANNLKNGHVKSCGCLRRDDLRNRAIHGHRRKEFTTRTYSSWCAMIQRCTNPESISYPKYGGAGVTVCEHWMTFENFLADMGERPEGTSLGRVLDTGNYEAGNCFWQTRVEQGLARRNLRSMLRKISPHHWQYHGDRWVQEAA